MDIIVNGSTLEVKPEVARLNRACVFFFFFVVLKVLELCSVYYAAILHAYSYLYTRVGKRAGARAAFGKCNVYP